MCPVSYSGSAAAAEASYAPLFPHQLVIAALKCHKYDKSIQVTGSAALYYLTNTEYRCDQSVRLRREVIQVVLNGMEQYQEVTVSLTLEEEEEWGAEGSVFVRVVFKEALLASPQVSYSSLLLPLQVQRNCCLTLCNFSIPEELEFQYSRVNLLLLKILEPSRQDESIQRIAVHLCNALVCQVDNHHKEAVGKMGFVKVTSPAFIYHSQDRSFLTLCGFNSKGCKAAVLLGEE